MKTTLLKGLSIFSFMILAASTTAQVKIVEISASALIEDKTVGEYSILIYNDGLLKDSLFIKQTKAVTLSLESGKLYSVLFKKANYPNKLVIVDTHIPSGLRELVEEPFELQIELAKVSES